MNFLMIKRFPSLMCRVSSEVLRSFQQSILECVQITVKEELIDIHSFCLSCSSCRTLGRCREEEISGASSSNVYRTVTFTRRVHRCNGDLRMYYFGWARALRRLGTRRYRTMRRPIALPFEIQSAFVSFNITTRSIRWQWTIRLSGDERCWWCHIRCWSASVF